MKKLLVIAFLATVALAAKAQTFTNITVKTTVDVIVTGVSTNSANSTLSLVGNGTKKDQNRINGWAFTFAQYRASGGTNAFEAWLKTDFQDRADEYSKTKQSKDNAALAATINTLLTQKSDLLSTVQMNQLIAIGALLP